MSKLIKENQLRIFNFGDFKLFFYENNRNEYLCRNDLFIIISVCSDTHLNKQYCKIFTKFGIRIAHIRVIENSSIPV